MLRRIRQQVLVTARRHVSASVAGDNRFILLQDDDGKSMKFPGIWLRDNCQCSECFHPPTGTRLINWNAFNPKVKVKSVQIASDDAQTRSVKVEWNDEHRCEFDWRWLKQRDFSLQSRQKALQETYPPPDLWSAKEFSSKLQRFDFDEVLRSDCALYDWIQALAVQGVAVISNAGDISGRVTKLANRIGFMKRTTYGEEFLVTSKPDATNYAYLMGGLPLHTDMPYYVYMPGIILLHYLIQSSSEGGANTICDGFYVARRLKWEYPEFYEILSSTPVDWYDIGAEGEFSFNSCHRAPVICLDSEGNCTRINHNQTRRDSHFRIDVDKVTPWYEAFSKFVELGQNETAEFKMQQGEVLSFNNLRMLHGRTAYKDTDDNTRCLEGTYIDWDIIYSKLRVLRSALHPRVN